MAFGSLPSAYRRTVSGRIFLDPAVAAGLEPRPADPLLDAPGKRGSRGGGHVLRLSCESQKFPS